MLPYLTFSTVCPCCPSPKPQALSSYYLLYFKQVLCEVVVVPLQVTVPLDLGGRTSGVTLLVVASTAATTRARPSSPKSPMSWCPVWSSLPPSTQLASNLAQVSEIDISISSPISKAFTKPSSLSFSLALVWFEEPFCKSKIMVVAGWSCAKGLPFFLQ